MQKKFRNPRKIIIEAEGYQPGEVSAPPVEVFVEIEKPTRKLHTHKKGTCPHRQGSPSPSPTKNYRAFSPRNYNYAVPVSGYRASYQKPEPEPNHARREYAENVSSSSSLGGPQAHQQFAGRYPQEEFVRPEKSNASVEEIESYLNQLEEENKRLKGESLKYRGYR